MLESTLTEQQLMARLVGALRELPEALIDKRA